MKTFIPSLALLGCVACGGSDGATGPGAAQDLEVRLAASTASYPHQDTLASQTARKVTAGVRTLELIDDQGGTWTVFTSSSAMTVSYDNGASTALAAIEPSAVRPGRYVQGRLIQDWSRFEVDATLHDGTSSSAGTLGILQVTSEGVELGGESYSAGDYEHTFSAAGTSKEFTGALPIPSASKTAEAEAKVENGAWVVYFPMDLQVPAEAKGTLTITANMDRAFRWTDMPSAENAENVYDIAPPLYELVEQFGANRFDVALTSSP